VHSEQVVNCVEVVHAVYFMDEVHCVQAVHAVGCVQALHRVEAEHAAYCMHSRQTLYLIRTQILKLTDP